MGRWRILLPISILVAAAIAAAGWAMRKRQDDLNRQLSEAAHDGDFAKVSELLKRGANPNGSPIDLISWTDPDSEKPPLYYAVTQDRPGAVQDLVKSGAKLDESGRGAGLLWVSLQKQDLEMYGLLLKLGANPSDKGPAGYQFNTLHWAVEFASRNDVPQELCVKFAKLAIQHGADVNYRGMNGSTPLTYAVGWKQEQLVEAFLDAGADLGLRTGEGLNAMDIAAQHGSEELISLLKARGAPYGIQEAAVLGDLPAVERMLAEDRSQLNARCFRGNSPLGLSLMNARADVSRYLMAQGASLKHLNDSGENLLHLAALGNCKDLVEALLDKGLEVNSRDESGETPLHETTFSDCAESAEILIRRGADINAKAGSAITATLWSCSYRSPRVLALLLKAGADPNAPGAGDGVLPLGSACQWGRPNEVPECVKILLAAGADVNRKDGSGKAPIHRAVAGPGGEPLVGYLLEHGADPSISDAKGRNALQLAIQEEKADVQRLLERRMGKTPPGAK